MQVNRLEAFDIYDIKNHTCYVHHIRTYIKVYGFGTTFDYMKISLYISHFFVESLDYTIGIYLTGIMEIKLFILRLTAHIIIFYHLYCIFDTEFLAVCVLRKYSTFSGCYRQIHRCVGSFSFYIRDLFQQLCAPKIDNEFVSMIK